MFCFSETRRRNLKPTKPRHTAGKFSIGNDPRSKRFKPIYTKKIPRPNGTPYFNSVEPATTYDNSEPSTASGSPDQSLFKLRISGEESACEISFGDISIECKDIALSPNKKSIKLIKP